MTKRPSVPIAAVLLSALLLAPDVRAEDIPWCSVDPVDRFQFLRRLSLDLRQRAPDLAEYQSLVQADDVGEEVVDRYLDSRDFRETVRAYHRDLLWPNLRGALLFNAVSQLGPVAGDPNGRLYVAMDERSISYRGKPGGQHCADRRQTAFEPDGTPIPGPDGLDGWVEVEPYWAPGTTVRVCAFDAQAKLVADDVIENRRVQLGCHVTASYVSRKCGCGPNLSFCNFGQTRGWIRDGLTEQMLRLVEDIVLNDRPYTELLLTRDVEVNGPASHYLRWQWGFAADVFVHPDGDWTVPEVPFTARGSWAKGERGPRHAGLLTLPAYLLRFQTNRARAHRFHNAFLCQPFNPPPGGLKLDASDEPNIMRRNGCSYCHQTLEPAAAYWGRFAEQGSTWLDPRKYPVENEACVSRAWQDQPLLRSACMRVYVSEREPRGVLRAFEFSRDGSPEAMQLARNSEEGPRGFALKAIDDGRFASCTVGKWWSHLLRREPTVDERETVLPQLAADFAASGYSLKSLVKAIVTHPSYRKAP